MRRTARGLVASAPPAAVPWREGVARLLETMSEALSGAESTDEVLRTCTEALVAHLGVTLARVWSRAAGADELVLRASAGLYTHTDGAHGRIRVGQYKIGRIAASGAPYATNRLVGDPEVHDQSWVRREALASFAGFPMVVEREVVGVVAVFARAPLDDDTLRILGAMARSIAMGMQRREARDALERRARVLVLRQALAQRMLSARSRDAVTSAGLAWLASTLGTSWVACVEVSARSKTARCVLASPRRRTGATVPVGRDELAALRSGVSLTFRAETGVPAWVRALAGRAAPSMREVLVVPVLMTTSPQIVCLAVGDALPSDAVELVLDAASTSRLAYERAALLEGLEDGQKALRQLSRKLMSAREEERKSIARELHDEMGQTLTALKLSVEALGAPGGAGEGASPLRETSLRLVSEVLQRIRGMTLELRPPMLEDFGLHVALVTLTERLERQGSLTVRYHQRGLARERVSPALETAVYRVVQEALTNVARHAGVREAHVTVHRTSTELDVTVRDDGRGFAASALGSGAGLLGMRERVAELGGALSVSSSRGRGCRVEARFPLREER